jgi:hypothetical protein
MQKKSSIRVNYFNSILIHFLLYISLLCFTVLLVPSATIDFSSHVTCHVISVSRATVPPGDAFDEAAISFLFLVSSREICGRLVILVLF